MDRDIFHQVLRAPSNLALKSSRAAFVMLSYDIQQTGVVLISEVSSALREVKTQASYTQSVSIYGRKTSGPFFYARSDLQNLRTKRFFSEPKQSWYPLYAILFFFKQTELKLRMLIVCSRVSKIYRTFCMQVLCVDA